MVLVVESNYELNVAQSMKWPYNRFICFMIKFSGADIYKIYKVIINLLAGASSAIMRKLHSITIYAVDYTSNRLSCHSWYPGRGSKTFEITLSRLYDAAELAGEIEFLNSVVSQCYSLANCPGAGELPIVRCLISPSIKVLLRKEEEKDAKESQEEGITLSRNELGTEYKKVVLVQVPVPVVSTKQQQLQLQPSCSSIINLQVPPKSVMNDLDVYSEREKSEGHGIDKIYSQRELTVNLDMTKDEIGTESVRELHACDYLIMKMNSVAAVYDENKNVIKKSQRETALPPIEYSLSRQVFYSSVLSTESSTESSLSRRSSCSSLSCFADLDSEESEENEGHRIKSRLRTKKAINLYMATFPYRVVGPGPGKRLLHEIQVSGKLEIRLQQSGYSPSNESDTDMYHHAMLKRRVISRTTKRTVIESESDT